MKVGRETRIRHRLEIGRLDPLVFVDINANAVVALFDIKSHLDEFGRKRLHMLRDQIVDRHVAPGHRGRDHVCSRLDLIRNDRVRISAGQPRNALDSNVIGSGALDVGAHRVQKVRDVDDMGLLSRVFDRRNAFGAGRRKHDIDCCADADHIQENMSAMQSVGDDANDAVANIGRIRSQRSELGKTLEMKIDRTCSEIAAPGHVHGRLFETGQQSAEKIIGGTNILNLGMRRLIGRDVGRIYLVHPRSQGRDDGTQCLTDFKHRLNVRDLRNIFENTRSVQKHGSCQNP